MKSTTLTLILLFTGMLSLSETASSVEFCEQRTTKAYHDPKCGLWVENDPHRINNFDIPFTPPYHTYSSWNIDSQTYYFAYRDIDYNPSDLVIDVYKIENMKFTQIGEIKINGVVVDILLARLTMAKYPEVVIRHKDGLLQFVSIVKIQDNKVDRIFKYGATEIDIIREPNPRIIAKAITSNRVEEFSWNAVQNIFSKTNDYPWHEQ